MARLGEPSNLLMVGEGIETCMAAMQATGNVTWAALSTSGLRSLDLHVGGIAESGHGLGISYPAEIYAGSTLRCGLEGVLPDILSKLQSVGVVAGETADVTARRLQSDRLRHHADDLLAAGCQSR